MITHKDKNVNGQSGTIAWYAAAMERLVTVVQELSHARHLDSIMATVRTAARELTHADGATFVLRDGDNCYYAEENAISPLWKGQHFPMKTCISGWVMLNRKPVIVENIYQDSRIPAEAYRPTFVQSLAMVPIRSENPIGAIGNYWATSHLPSQEELAILQALAHVISVAMENVALYARLQEKVQALEKSNHELNRFAWVASHDLKSPLRAIDHLSCWIEEDIDENNLENTREHIHTLRDRVRRMEKFLDDIMEYAHVDQKLMQGKDTMTDGFRLKEDLRALIDLPEGFRLKFSNNFNKISVPHVPLQSIFYHLISNAIKHHDQQQGLIYIHVTVQDGKYVFSVSDDGPGIPPEYQAKIFEMFQTLKPRDVMEGSGMGLALVKKILSLYGGEIWLDSGPEREAVFRFTWPIKNPMHHHVA